MHTSQARVLVIWPPHVPSYFNAGHHLGLFEVAAYLRKRAGVRSVTCIDAGALNYNWKEIGDRLFEGFDVVAMQNEFDALEGVERMTEYVRALCPAAKIVTFGRLSATLPRFFERYDVDAIVQSGDYESGVASYVDWLARPEGEPPPGVAIRGADGFRQPSAPGVFLPEEAWVLPDVREIPYAAYGQMYASDQNKFCGIPQRQELVLPIARGCPVGCDYCDVPGREGRKERRLTVERTIRYIEESFAQIPFEYVAMYAPTFTLNQKWVLHLCEELRARGNKYPWKCTTTMHHLNEDLVRVMGQSRCVRISVGLETLDPVARTRLPGLKQTDEERLAELASWCRAAGIELNCFVILGMPGGTVEGTQFTVQKVREYGARLRPTIYTPFHTIGSDADEKRVGAHNKQLFAHEIDAHDARQFYAIYFGKEENLTQVMARVPQRSADAAAGPRGAPPEAV